MSIPFFNQTSPESERPNGVVPEFVMDRLHAVDALVANTERALTAMDVNLYEDTKRQIDTMLQPSPQVVNQQNTDNITKVNLGRASESIGKLDQEAELFKAYAAYEQPPAIQTGGDYDQKAA